MKNSGGISPVSALTPEQRECLDWLFRERFNMHDRNGTPLKVGDIVTIEYEITHCDAGPDYCNITAKSREGRQPDGMAETFCGNSRVCVLQKSAP